MAFLPPPTGGLRANTFQGPTPLTANQGATPNSYVSPTQSPLNPTPPGGGNGSSGSFSISPDAGIYGAESAAALSAYQAAQAQLLAQRNGLYNQYGFTTSGVVDPNNPYGQYQMLLSSEGNQLTADQNNAAARNLGTGGLARQQESFDRFQQGAQNVQFQKQVGDVATNYNLGLQQSKSDYDRALAQAYSDAMNAALQQAMLQFMSSSWGGGGLTPDNSKTTDNSTTSGRTSTANTGVMRLPTTRVRGGKI